MGQIREGVQKEKSNDAWSWALGLAYIVAVATIWIAASYIVQSVVDSGVSPFLITYICNSLFMIYIPIVEIVRYLEDSFGNLRFWHSKGKDPRMQQSGDSENSNLLQGSDHTAHLNILMSQHGEDTVSGPDSSLHEVERISSGQDESLSQLGALVVDGDSSKQLGLKGRWTRTQVAKASLWSNTILSSASSLFTFLVSLAFLGEKFTWLKLISVLLCMGGTIIVSLGDSEIGVNAIATNPPLGDILALVSSFLYAVYITLIRIKLPDEKKGQGQASMAQFLGFLGLFNFLIFLPVALVLNFTKLEPFYKLSWKQFGLIVGKGLLDNVFSDYLWAKAILLTTTTVATAGLTIQVPLAAIVDSLIGHAPHLMDYLGAAAVIVGFAGINIPSDACCGSQGTQQEQETEKVCTVGDG